jgi:hypothetical protein
MNAPTAGRYIRIGVAAAALGALTGCATPSLYSARQDFYAGRIEQAGRTLAEADPGQDRVLFWMERGTIRQAAAEYTNSARDFISAYDRIEELQTYSMSRGGASMVVNDTVQEYRGFPYERTLLHAFTAKDHLALGRWEDAAVEARRIIGSLEPEAKGDYPDDAYSRYMAGFCLEMVDDRSNAGLQYRKAAELLSAVGVDDKTGRLGSRADSNSVASIDTAAWPSELVCFVMLGRAPQGNNVWRDDWSINRPAYAEIVVNGQVLGRSYNLADTLDLAFTTEQKEAARKMVKTVARVAVKESIAYQIEQDNELLGELVRFVLIGLLEKPDTRRWETLPRYLQVARVPCPPDLKDYTVVFRNHDGGQLGSIHVTAPLHRKGKTFVSICRDLVPVGK